MHPSRWAVGLVAVGLVLLGLSFVGGPSPQPVTVVAAPTTTAPTPTLAEQGQALFRAKGCATCHEHALNGAPNLASYEANPEFLVQWLKNPTAVRPGTLMPNLGLDDSEIQALIAFLAADDQP